MLVVTDLAGDGAENYGRAARSALPALKPREDLRWRVLEGTEFKTPKDLLAVVETERPDLIVTYRNLKSEAWKYPFSLGVFLDVLAQATTTPVLVLPHPKSGVEIGHPANDPNCVMAITDHLSGDHALVNYAAYFTTDLGTLHLTHIEDDVAFQRFMNAISKIPNIDTDEARTLIERQLLKEPHDYITSVAK